MRIERISVSSQRKVPHPIEDFGTISAHVSLEASLDAGEAHFAAVLSLQAEAEDLVEQHLRKVAGRLKAEDRSARASAKAKLGDGREDGGAGGEAWGGSVRPRIRMRARPRHVQGEMNGLETRYAQHLTMRQQTGQIASYRYEAVKLRLARKTFVTVDFWVVLPDGRIELHEVKGHWEDDARVKVKVAAELFHEFEFVGVTYDRRAGWQYERFGG